MKRYQCLVSAGLCGICGREIAGYGYSGRPITRGKCCDDCLSLVIERRMRDMARNEKVLERLRGKNRHSENDEIAA